MSEITFDGVIVEVKRSSLSLRTERPIYHHRVGIKSIDIIVNVLASWPHLHLLS